MTITFITGANKSLGYETARRLTELGHTVLLGARDAARGAEAAQRLGVRFVQLDVTDEASVAAAVADVEAHEGHIDVLINNAGITGPQTPADQITADAAIATYQVNLFGPIRVTAGFLPLLRRSDNPVVVNVASGLGSGAWTHDPAHVEFGVTAPLYTSSKSALIMLTTQYAKGIPDVKFNVVDPGYTATDLNGHSGHQTVTEGTDAIVAMASIGTDGPTGTFTDRTGVVPW
ncbi:SDR family NAD(P)-dependent oxidoreductase [Naasia lichenicola]|uniref:SDR family NAD(P)-dependent oxidoreductase n=1 Tax=Naasia lichenicola TaxID=2565933 RepID=A0A4S4FU65_9MICO|nr:SDR family NAD(P)-dependent oxidoreductase [Naasia lichenicola]THG33335.1 SDR family NAD(P)-dependent oxidoreductase [Naasia lichenicola]